MLNNTILGLLTMAFCTGVSPSAVTNEFFIQAINLLAPGQRLGSESFVYQSAIPRVHANFIKEMAQYLQNKYLCLQMDAWTPKHGAYHYNGVCASLIDCDRSQWKYINICVGLHCIMGGTSRTEHTDAKQLQNQ